MRRHLAALILLAAIRSTILAADPPERGTRPGWVAQASGTTKTLLGVWGADVSTVFVVGKEGTVLRWDGRAWSALAAGSASNLTSLWGASPEDLFAAGDGGVILHFDGTAWTKQETGTTVNLDAVWGSSGRDVFAVGDADGTILRFDGKAWHRMASGTDAPLFGVWGSGPTDVYAVGMGATVLRFDGKAWGKVATGVEGHFTGVWGSSTSDVFAVGTGGTVAHFDGKTWTRMATGSTQHLTRVWGSGPADVYAVGAEGAVVHFDGTAWKPMASGAAVSLYGVWGAAGRVFAVGREGTILRLGPPGNDIPDIHAAAERGEVERVRALIAAEPALIRARNADRRTPLHVAARAGQVGVMEVLLAAGADPNAADAIGSTGLHGAAFHGREAALRLLLANGADPDAQDSRGNTALVNALYASRQPLVGVLLAAGANVNLKDQFGSPPLHTAVRRGYLAEVGEMLARGADIQAHGFNLSTALHLAVEYDRPEILDLLLARGASAGGRDAMGDLPLHKAAALGRQDIAARLVTHTTDLEAKNDLGRTALQQAAAGGHTSVVRQLLERGAARDGKDLEGLTALDLARNHGHRKVASVLEHGPAASWSDRPAPPPDAPQPKGAVTAWYLGNAGWAVRIGDRLLVFDYWNYGVAPDQPSLASGRLVPDELKGLKVYVFTTHVHPDHYDPAILQLASESSNVTLVFGWALDTDTRHHRFTGRREARRIDDLEVSQISDGESSAFLVRVEGLALYHGGDFQGGAERGKEYEWLAGTTGPVDVAFVDLGESVRATHLPALEVLRPRIVFPMHAGRMESVYQTVATEVERQFPRSRFLCARDRGDRFDCSRPEGTPQNPGAPVDAFGFVRGLDEAGARQEWPGFNPSEWPIAVFDGSRTLLFHHASPPPGFTPLPDRPGVLAMPGQHPAVTGNSVRDIGGVRTATVAPRPGRPPEDAMLAVVEELFHVFWSRRHTSFRPNEMARYAYPVKDAQNLRLVLAEDEALARALEADSLPRAAEWAAAALGIRHEREPHLTADERAFETGLEMMEGTANAVARSVVGQRPEATGARLRLDWPAEEIRWRFYNTGAAVCFLLDRFQPGWKSVIDRDLEQTTVGLLEAALARTGAKPASFSPAELAGFERRAAASVADLSARQKKLRDELAGRAGTRILLEVPEGLPPLRVVRFDPLGVFVLDGGEAVHPGTLALSVPDGAVEVTNPGFTRGSFAGTVALTRGAGRHPFAGGIRTLTIVGVTGTPKVDSGGSRLTIEAEGIRISLPAAVAESEADTLRVRLSPPARPTAAAAPDNKGQNRR